MLPRLLSVPRACAALLFATVAALPACAPRAVPSQFPPTSAASLQATEARAPSSPRALRGDPPLPGEPTAGWTGLEEGTATEGTPTAPSPTSTAAEPGHAH